MSQGQPVLHREFQDSQGYTEKTCLKKRETKREAKKESSRKKGKGEKILKDKKSKEIFEVYFKNNSVTSDPFSLNKCPSLLAFNNCYKEP